MVLVLPLYLNQYEESLGFYKALRKLMEMLLNGVGFRLAIPMLNLHHWK